MNTLNLVLALALSAPGALTAPASPSQGAQGAQEAQAAPIRVVATLPIYAEIARAVGGDAVEVSSIADPAEDAHFVRPKPSYALRIRQADVFITTGLDLELWVPALLDKAGNARVSEGGSGYITTYPGIALLDVPTATDRSEGDIHVYGNPHVFTDPLNVVQVARNIAAGLKRAAPSEAARFDRSLAAFADQVHRRLFGAELVSLLGGDTLERLARQGGLLEFLRALSAAVSPVAQPEPEPVRSTTRRTGRVRGGAAAEVTKNPDAAASCRPKSSCDIRKTAVVIANVTHLRWPSFFQNI